MKTILAVTAAALLSAAPALAQDANHLAPALTLNDHVPMLDTGSEQMPRSDGQAATPESEAIIAPSASEAEVESVNSLPAVGPHG